MLGSHRLRSCERVASRMVDSQARTTVNELLDAARRRLRRLDVEGLASGASDPVLAVDLDRQRAAGLPVVPGRIADRCPGLDRGEQPCAQSSSP